MAYRATPEVIISIKKEIERRRLSVSQVDTILREAGFPLGVTTIRRVLREGSENKDHFRYETTIQPFWTVFMRDLDEDVNEKDLRKRIQDMEVLIGMKDEAIADLRDRLASMEVAHGEKCKDCSSKKDKQLEEQRAEILRLQGQVDRLLNIVLSRFESIT